MIKSLRFIDPSGVLLERVGDGVKDYLRGRHDTVRCIVKMLTDDSELFEELGRGGEMALDTHGDSDDEGVQVVQGTGMQGEATTIS